MTDKQCLENAERYCRERAAMSWTDEERQRWHNLAEWNRKKIEELEKIGTGTANTQTDGNPLTQSGHQAQTLQ